MDRPCVTPDLSGFGGLVAPEDVLIPAQEGTTGSYQSVDYFTID